MSAPEQQLPGGTNLFPESFAACLALSRVQHRLIEALDPEIVAKAHDFAARLPLEDGIEVPELRHCQAVLYMDGLHGNETGGLQFNFARPVGSRLQMVGARVVAYYPGEPFITEAEPFTGYEAQQVAEAIDRLAQVCAGSEVLVSPDLTSIFTVRPIPIFRTA